MVKYTLIPKGEIKQWDTTNKYGHFGEKISRLSNLSWIKMPLISIACERAGFLPLDKISVPNDEKDFWENYFFSEILEIEERIKDKNVKEPSLALQGSPKYNFMKKRLLINIIFDVNSWNSTDNLKDDLQNLVLGSELDSKLLKKSIEILECILPEDTKLKRTINLPIKHNSVYIKSKVIPGKSKVIPGKSKSHPQKSKSHPQKSKRHPQKSKGIRKSLNALMV